MEKEQQLKDHNVYPLRLDAEELRQIAEFYDSLTEEEWIAHDEYAYENPYTVDVLVPKALLHAVRELVARHEADHPEATAASRAWLDRKSDGPDNLPARLELGTSAAPHRRDGSGRGKLDRGKPKPDCKRD